MYSYLYVQKSTNPMSLGNYNSQGYIGESTSSSGCIDTPDNSYNTGSVSFTIYVYTLKNKKKYIKTVKIKNDLDILEYSKKKTYQRVYESNDFYLSEIKSILLNPRFLVVSAHVIKYRSFLIILLEVLLFI